MEGKRKTGRKRLGSAALLHLVCSYTIKWSYPSRTKLCFSLRNEVTGSRGNVRIPFSTFVLPLLVYSSLLLCSLFSSMSIRKFEGRREKGIEGMSWGNDNKVGSTAPHLWTKTVLNLSIPLVSLFSLPFPSVLRVSVSYYLFFPSPSAVTRSQMKNG